jgi:hypothetical protein
MLRSHTASASEEMTPCRQLGVFSDDVFTSTQLNRSASVVLNRARTRPVTIVRNNEQFALLRRDQASELVTAVAQLEETVRLILGVSALKDGKDPSASIAWIRALDEEERASMVEEVLAACKRAGGDGGWESVGNIMHEWRESALVAQSSVLMDAMRTEADEQPLPRPTMPEPDR